MEEGNATLDRFIYCAFTIAVIFALIMPMKSAINDISQTVDKIYEAVEESSEFQEALIDGIRAEEKYGIPGKYYRILRRECDKRGVDVDFMVKLMYVESRFDSRAVSRRGAYGLMQLQYPTAKSIDPSLASKWQLFDPETNIRVGVEYFRILLNRYNWDYVLASIAYNRGPTRLDRELLSGELIRWYHDKVAKVGTDS